MQYILSPRGRRLRRLSAAPGLLCLALAASAPAHAESTYGYSAVGTGVVTATARVNLSVTVPKLILLKVGSSGGTIDTLSWTTGFSIPATPTTPSVTANNAPVTWNGTAPTVSTSADPAALAVAAWSNSTGSTVNCAATAIGAGGPTLANFAVTATGTLPHPGANLGSCAATPAIAANTLVSSNWAYALGGTPATWLAGAYSSVVTYTATSL
ncbi:hypothetical protein [Variovorax terrae]|uniref:Secreted protein n=1 Tax=Variovorax terrae TaxID=2923278 RepID=A0A9X1VZ09_9BURK|nr:hypothetical protein [Variovorax terrae]MCJ0764774.1 hypothetical protein [Variovorax terrae]